MLLGIWIFFLFIWMIRWIVRFCWGIMFVLKFWESLSGNWGFLFK